MLGVFHQRHFYSTANGLKTLKSKFSRISAEVQEIHYEKLVERKNKVVSTLAHGIEHLLQNNITLIKGEATILKA